mmetsp:Transcript_25123/g.68251  ORF Transcript_25123/g.68251 Transcript_25123/m.68251 type:complete len:338 (-) Transcript_25123:615-1628(-)
MASYDYGNSYYAPPSADPVASAVSAPPAAAPAPLYPPPAYGVPPPGTYGAPPPYGAPYSAPPPYGAPPPFGAPPPGMGVNPDEVRTIFITGFPQDVKERELNNLLRFLPGYEASQLNWKNNLAQGFALFSAGAYARAACDAITQLAFDDTSVLRCEMARKNMYIKSDPEGKRARIGAGGPSSYAAMQPFSRGPGLPGNSPSALSDNPPCNTLFVGNLSDNINEAELTSVFSTSPGFRTVKVLRGRTTTAFVAYETTEQAIQAHGAHQNAVLASNAEKGSIRIQFSKNPFGRKRDYNGEPAGGGDPLAAAAAAGAAAAAAAASKAAYEPAPYNPLASL